MNLVKSKEGQRIYETRKKIKAKKITHKIAEHKTVCNIKN